MHPYIPGTGGTEAHARLILGSYRRWLGKELLAGYSGSNAAEALFHAPMTVLSHGTEPDPILNYGNRSALKLWEMDGETFIRMPSRLKAEPMERRQRELFFERVTSDGYVDNYTGIRISSTGKRFYILQAVVWNLLDEQGSYRGQAAAFSDYRYCGHK